jgi:hypothetical protein
MTEAKQQEAGRAPGSPAVNHSSTVPPYGPGMDETQDLALRALRELLDDPERNDWDDLLAANRALIKAIAKNKPMTRSNARIVSEYIREAGWGEGNRRGHEAGP